MDDTVAQTQRLKASIHFTTGQICQTIASDCGREFSRQAIAAIAETAFRQCDTFSKDLEAFARHAKRNTINVDDVKLVSRRSTALSAYIQQKSEELASAHQEQKERRKKNSVKRKHQEAEDDPGQIED